uniref:Uncharacterized protein n=1 Tax=Triticum urartu TaxID=4572 RepID=A0A8R7V1I0_TRIUA
ICIRDEEQRPAGQQHGAPGVRADRRTGAAGVRDGAAPGGLAGGGRPRRVRTVPQRGRGGRGTAASRRQVGGWRGTSWPTSCSFSQRTSRSCTTVAATAAAEATAATSCVRRTKMTRRRRWSICCGTSRASQRSWRARRPPPR